MRLEKVTRKLPTTYLKRCGRQCKEGKWGALHQAAYYGHREIAELLIAKRCLCERESCVRPKTRIDTT